MTFQKLLICFYEHSGIINKNEKDNFSISFHSKTRIVLLQIEVTTKSTIHQYCCHHLPCVNQIQFVRNQFVRVPVESRQSIETGKYPAVGSISLLTRFTIYVSPFILFPGIT